MSTAVRRGDVFARFQRPPGGRYVLVNYTDNHGIWRNERSMTFTRHVRRLFAAGESGSTYECGNCGREFDLDRQVCPRCGSYRIQRSSYEDLVSD